MNHFPNRRSACRMLVASAAATALAALVPAAWTASAQADPVGDAQAQAALLAQKITSQQTLVDQLSERFDGAQYHLAQVQAEVARARAAVDQASAQWRRVSSQVVGEAVTAYTNGGFAPPTVAAPGSADPLIAESYFALATNRQSDSLDQLRQTQQALAAEETALGQAETNGKAALGAADARRQAVAQAEAQAQTTLASVKGQIAGMVAAAQARQQTAQRATLQAQLDAVVASQHPAAASGAGGASLGAGGSGLLPAPGAKTPAAAVPVTSAPRSPTPSRSPATSPSQPSGGPPPAPAGGSQGESSTAARAVRVAMAQVGKPYEYGAAGPDTFDCSGLVQFAYGAAGVSLPHYTVAQWDDTTHIPLSSIQPGDLIFFYSDFHHVGIYIGNGNMVDAPHTGAFVRVEPIAGFGPIVGASRVG